jgi:hypothetical protein
VSAPAGWYPDPNGAVRWWDGYRWTETVQGMPQREVESPRVAEGTSSSTVWIWMIVVLPLVPLITSTGLLLSMRGPMMSALASLAQAGSDPYAAIALQSAIFGNPWYFINIVVAWAAIGVSIWFAYLDRRELLRRGFLRPFHWAWSFFAFLAGGFGELVYIIGRSVRVHGQSGRGLAPLWASIAVLGVQLAASVWLGFIMLQWFSEFMSVLMRLAATHSGSF